MAPKGKKGKKDKKGKKGKKGKGKKEQAKTIPVDCLEPPVAFDTHLAVSSIVLLSSPEEVVMLQALAVLAKYAHERPFFPEFLLRKDCVNYLLPILYNDNVVALRLCLKLLAQILRLPDALYGIRIAKRFTLANQILCILMEHKDKFVKEFVIPVLTEFVKSSQLIADTVYTEDLIKKIFELLVGYTDPDIQYNILELFFYVLESRNAEVTLGKSDHFQPRYLLCFIKSEVKEIQSIALSTVEKISYFRNEELFEKMNSANFYKFLLSTIIDDNYKGIRKRLLGILIHTLEFKTPVQHMLKMEEFLKFCLWTIHCEWNYLELISTCLKRFTEHKNFLQTYYDLSFEETVLSMFRTSNIIVFYNSCVALINLSDHYYCLNKISQPVMLDRILDIFEQKGVEIVPYFEIAVKTLYNFASKNELILCSLGNVQGFHHIPLVLENHYKDFTFEGLTTLISLIALYAMRSQFKNKIISRELYKIIMELFKEDTTQAIISLNIIHQYITNRDYREYFLDLEGHKLVIEKLRYTYKEDMFLKIMYFLQNILMYKQVNNAFVRAKLLPLLKYVKKHMLKQIPCINTIINLIYKFNLSLKFFETNRLEIDDLILEKEPFYVINGKWDEEFPFLEILQNMKISTLSTIYLVDFCSFKLDEETKKELYKKLKCITEEKEDSRVVVVSAKNSLLSKRSESEKESNSDVYIAKENQVKNNSSDVIETVYEKEKASFEKSSSSINQKTIEDSKENSSIIKERKRKVSFHGKIIKEVETKTVSEDFAEKQNDLKIEQQKSCTSSDLILLSRVDSLQKHRRSLTSKSEEKYDYVSTSKEKVLREPREILQDDIEYASDSKNSIELLTILNAKDDYKDYNFKESVEFSVNEDKTLSLPKEPESDFDLKPNVNKTVDENSVIMSLKDEIKDDEDEKPLNLAYSSTSLSSIINYGKISPDSCLPLLLEQARILIYYKHANLKKLSDKVKLLATFVCRQLSGPLENDLQLRHVFNVHLQELKEKLGTNIIPIGFLQRGLYCERAILFKALGDQLNIYSALVKNSDLMFWNEVPIITEAVNEDPLRELVKTVNYFIVDLMKNVGNLIPCGSFEASRYCGIVPKILPKKIDEDKPPDLTSATTVTDKPKLLF